MESAMLRNVSIVMAVATWFAASTGCVDPGCIRNSECGSGFECKNARCIRDDPGLNNTVKAGTAGSVLSALKDAGSTQPDTGSAETPATDAGKM
jgi:Cys-rich repeat protein